MVDTRSRDVAGHLIPLITLTAQEEYPSIFTSSLGRSLLALSRPDAVEREKRPYRTEMTEMSAWLLIDDIDDWATRVFGPSAAADQFLFTPCADQFLSGHVHRIRMGRLDGSMWIPNGMPNGAPNGGGV